MFREQLAKRRHGDVEDVCSPPLHRDTQRSLILEPSTAQESLERAFRGVFQSHKSLFALPGRLAVDELRLLEHEPEVR